MNIYDRHLANVVAANSTNPKIEIIIIRVCSIINISFNESTLHDTLLQWKTLHIVFPVGPKNKHIIHHQTNSPFLAISSIFCIQTVSFLCVLPALRANSFSTLSEMFYTNIDDPRAAPECAPRQGNYFSHHKTCQNGGFVTKAAREW